MKFLLDVNALIALGIKGHQQFPRVASWALAQDRAAFLTCSVTEIGFARVVAQVPAYGHSVQQARALLQGMKSNPVLNLRFLADNNDISHLPAWVKTPAQATDGHLVQLAHAHSARLATLDRGIPGAFVIP